jgi:hypothetical protein
MKDINKKLDLIDKKMKALMNIGLKFWNHDEIRLKD